MKCLSLFTGIGGFDLALQKRGHEIVGACEIDKWARRVYAKHFPGVHIYEDATQINASELPDFELLVAGFPCQTFSIAGNRLGFEESRGTLFFEIARIAKQKRPRLLLLENVKGLLSHDGGKTFAEILATLDEIGYDAQWQVLNSKYFVPQNRERIFIIAHLRGTSRPEVFPLGEAGQATDRGTSTKQVAATLQHPGHSAGNYKGMNLVKVGNIAESGHDSLWGRVYDPKGISQTLGAEGGGLGAKTGLYAISSMQKHATVNKEKAPALTESMGTGGGHVPMIYGWSKSTREKGRIEERIKEGEANTLSTGDGCRNQSTASYVADDTKVRRLTPKECERLQGFPDNYTQYTVDGEKLSDTQRYKMCGNAVTVNVIEYILEYL